MTHTVDENTIASSPGQIEISKIKFFDYIELMGIKRIKYNILFSLPSNFLYKLFSSDEIVYDYIQKQEQFKFGCLNPTIVINKEKGLIATFTNLTSIGDEITPVVKISKEPLGLIKSIKVVNGQKLPTVALYTRNTEDEFATAWTDFTPKVANCFTDDLTICNELLSRLSSNSWKCLDLGLAQVYDKEQEGLYYVKLQKDLVQSSY